MFTSATRLPLATSLHGMNYPVRMLPAHHAGRPNQTRPQAIRSSSIDIVERCCPPGWISVGSQFGSLTHSFQQLNPTMSLLPSLIVESSLDACTICQLAVPTATVIQADLALFSRTLHSIVLLPTIPLLVPDQPCPMKNNMQQFLAASPKLAGIDLHAPSSSSSTLSTHWLQVALRTVDLLSQQTQLCCFLFSVSLRDGAEHLGNQLSSAFVNHFHGRQGWMVRCGASSTSFFGDPVFAEKWIALGYREEAGTRHATFPPTVRALSTLSQCIDVAMNRRSAQAFTFCADQRMWKELPPQPATSIDAQFLPQTLFEITATPPGDSTRLAPIIAVQHPDFPAPEPNRNHDGTSFEQSYGIPFTDVVGTNSVRPASSIEILRTFSFPSHMIDELRYRHFLAQAVNVTRSGIPFHLASAFARQIFDSGVFPFPNDDPRNHEHLINCFPYSPKPIPTAASWDRAYRECLTTAPEHRWSKK